MLQWQQQPPERAGIYACDGYEVRWYFEGGTGYKRWQAKNPAGEVRQGFLTKLAAMAACVAQIKRRKEDNRTPSEIEAFKAAGRAQIAAMKEMNK